MFSIRPKKDRRFRSNVFILDQAPMQEPFRACPAASWLHLTLCWYHHLGGQGWVVSVRKSMLTFMLHARHFDLHRDEDILITFPTFTTSKPSPWRRTISYSVKWLGLTETDALPMKGPIALTVLRVLHPR